MAAAGETTHFCDEADGFVGVGKHLGGVTDAPVIKEVAEGHAAGTLADGICLAQCYARLLCLELRLKFRCLSVAVA